jgi:hypothetical protein
MPILREWRARILRPKTAAYVEYGRTTGIAGYRRTPGNPADAEYLLTRPATVIHYESSELYSPATAEGSAQVR